MESIALDIFVVVFRGFLCFAGLFCSLTKSYRSTTLIYFMILFVLSSLLIDWECSSVLICSSIVTFFPVRFSLAIIYLVPFISISFCIFLLIAWYYFSHWLSFFLYLFAFCWTFICFSWKFLCHCAFVDLKLDSLFFLFPK